MIATDICQKKRVEVGNANVTSSNGGVRAVCCHSHRVVERIATRAMAVVEIGVPDTVSRTTSLPSLTLPKQEASDDQQDKYTGTHGTTNNCGCI